MSTIDVYALINGPADSHRPETGPEYVVLPQQLAPASLGPPNAQLFQSGHTNNLRTNPSAEQGDGKPPGWGQWGHYPHVQQPNPARNLGNMLRAGGDSYSADVYRPEVVAYWAQALHANMQEAPRKQRGPVTPVANQADSVPFVAVVPPILAQAATPYG